MIQTINISDFRNAFHQMGRGNQFSYKGLELIFNYFEQYEQDINEAMELDVIAICCDISEMTPQEISQYYDFELAEDGNEMANAVDHLNDKTIIVGESDSTILFFNF